MTLLVKDVAEMAHDVSVDVLILAVHVDHVHRVEITKHHPEVDDLVVAGAAAAADGRLITIGTRVHAADVL